MLKPFDQKLHSSLFIIIFGVLLILSLFIIKPFLFSLLGGLIVAYIFYPLYRLVNLRVTNRTVASLIVSLCIVGLLVLSTFFVVNLVSREAVVIFIEGKRILLSADTLARQCGASFCDSLEQALADGQLQVFLQERLKDISAYLAAAASTLVLGIPRILANTFIMFFVVFYALRDGPRFSQYLQRVLKSGTDHHELVFSRFNEVMYAVVYGNILLALAQGLVGGLGFWIFGISSPLAWAFVMTFFALIPYVGAAIIWVPASLVLLANGLILENNTYVWKGIGLFLWGFLLVSTIDNLLKPRVIGERSRIHPVAVLLGILGGIAFMGAVGIVIGPLIIAMAFTFLDIYMGGNVTQVEK